MAYTPNDYTHLGKATLEQIMNAVAGHAPDIRAAAPGWQQFAKSIVSTITGGGSTPTGVDSFDSIMTLLKDWQGPAADEFRKQANVIRQFGLDTAGKADALAVGGGYQAQAFWSATDQLSQQLDKVVANWTQYQKNRKSLGTFLTWLAQLGDKDFSNNAGQPQPPENLPGGWSYQTKTIQDPGSSPTGHTFILTTDQGTFEGAVNWSWFKQVSLDNFYHGGSVATIKDVSDGGESPGTFDLQSVTPDWVNGHFQESYRRGVAAIVQTVGDLYTSTHPQIPDPPDKSTLPTYTPPSSSPQYGPSNGAGAYGGSSGFNPGTGLSGHNPGNGISGFNPGTGLSGHNPGNGISGFNPDTGISGHNPGNGTSTSGYSPGSYGSGSYNPGTYGSGYDPGSKLASFDPNGAGGFGGNGLYTPGSGSGLGGGLGGVGSSGLGGTGAGGGAGGGLGAGGLGAGGVAGEGAGAAGMAGRGGTPMMPPMGGQGGGKDGKERQRNAWLNESEDVWGADGDEAPDVL